MITSLCAKFIGIVGASGHRAAIRADEITMIKVCDYFESKACVEIYIKSIQQPYTIICATLEAAIAAHDDIIQLLKEINA